MLLSHVERRSGSMLIEHAKQRTGQQPLPRPLAISVHTRFQAGQGAMAPKMPHWQASLFPR